MERLLEFIWFTFDHVSSSHSLLSPCYCHLLCCYLSWALRFSAVCYLTVLVGRRHHRCPLGREISSRNENFSAFSSSNRGREKHLSRHAETMSLSREYRNWAHTKQFNPRTRREYHFRFYLLWFHFCTSLSLSRGFSRRRRQLLSISVEWPIGQRQRCTRSCETNAWIVPKWKKGFFQTISVEMWEMK